MSDQERAEQLDEDELPTDLAPENFIEPEDWDAGAGADETQTDSDYHESQLGQEREAPIPAEEAAMHVEQGNATE